MQREIIETDVLCIGGGIAGLMAAIRAREMGAKVVVAEKGNALASGAGRAGNDHFQCYIPEVHGPDLKGFSKKLQSFRNQIRDYKYAETWAKNALDIIKLWDSWGIPMKYQGKWEFAGHSVPGGLLDHLKYSGQNQKPVLHREALKRGVEIINRVMIIDLLREGNSVVGAVGIGAREDKLYIFRAKSVIMATGFVVRLYPSPLVGTAANINFPMTVTGDGRAMAFRAGAALVGLDMPYKHSGPKYFCRSGQATWVGVIKDGQGNPIGPFVNKPDKRYGDGVLEKYPTLFEDIYAAGKGPVYMDCTGGTQEDYDYMVYFMRHEGYSSYLKHLEEENIDLRKTPVEFGRYEIRINGGIYYNEKAETTVKGLYAAGDEYFGGIANAAIFGWLAGENAAQYAPEKQPVSSAKSLESFISAREAQVEAIKARECAAEWREVNTALQQLMADYAGNVRSETLFDAGIANLRRLKEKAHATIGAKNQWELVRALETLNLLDLGEMVMVASKERRETRGQHIRKDYPVTNPQLDKSRLFVTKENDQMVTRWKEIQD